MSLTIESFPFNDYENPLRVPTSKILIDELYKDTDDTLDIRMFRNEMAETDDLHTLALKSGEFVVATSSIRIDTIDDPVTRIRNVAVAKNSKRNGYGGIILSAAENYIIDNQQEEGIKLAQVEPSDVSIPFYNRMGYRFISSDSTLMVKVIS